MFEEGLGSPPGEGARLQEGFLLLLVLVDQLRDQRGAVVVAGRVPGDNSGLGRFSRDFI